MPRKPRLFFPEQPVHIVKRGHNRDPIVARKVDYQYFVECLASACHEYGVALHAWVLMTNHIHLLASPETEDSLPKMMQWLGGHYSRYFNKCYRRSGSMWEGRYKTSLIDSDEYLLKCYRYIELNPVRAGMVEYPQQYPWSSYRENVGIAGVRLKSDPEIKLKSDPEIKLKSGTETKLGTGLSLSSTSTILSPHPVYLDLSQDDNQRYSRYQSLFQEALDRQTLMKIKRGLEKGKPVGNPEFLLKIAKMRS